MAKKHKSKSDGNAIGCGCLALIALAVAVSEAANLAHQNPAHAMLILSLIASVIFLVMARSRALSFEGRTNVPVRDFQHLPKLAKPAGYVYVIKDYRYHKYKIGRTIDPKSRLKAIQRNEVGDLRFLKLIRTSDANALENQLHRRYADARIRPDREWFQLSNAQLQELLGVGTTNRTSQFQAKNWAGASVALAILFIAGVSYIGSIESVSTFAPKSLLGSTGVSTRNSNASRAISTKIGWVATAIHRKTRHSRPTPTRLPPPTASPRPVTSAVRYVRDLGGKDRANVRACPSTKSCAILGKLESGARVRHLGVATGERLRGSNLWTRMSYKGTPAWVHSSLLSELHPPSPTPAS